MAVRVRLCIRASDGAQLVTTAVLNGGFEVPDPHILLPHAAAERLLGDGLRKAVRQEMTGAGGPVELLALPDPVTAHAFASDREGPRTRFHLLVSRLDEEALVSDAGIDALSIRIESFAPGRWRFADETRIRDSEPPQYW
ncbi:MAG: hypothetical protein HY815_03710 [Candidatus Riflebacteria bacterium]|nr:hypothetical protein [Candidatus Riflebacteria bacterium]